MKLQLSACLIVRNEQHTLPGCLASIAPHVAETIVVDTGSTDQTRHIALQHGARQADFAWCDDFAAARNFASALAMQPHIFVIDADERLDPRSLAALEDYCRTGRDVVGRVIRTNLADDQTTALTVESISRLYPNSSDFRYSGRIHEQILRNGTPTPAVQTEVRLVHHGYAATTLASSDKVRRNLRLLELAHADDPTNAYVVYQIGRTHQAAGQFAAAEGAYRTALAHLHDSTPPYLSSLLVQLGYALLEQRDLAGVLDVLSVATDLYPSFTDLYFLYGLTLLELDDTKHLADIRLTFEHCLALGEPDPRLFESVPGVGSYRALFNLGVFHQSIGDARTANEYFARAAEHGFPPALQRSTSSRRSADASSTAATRVTVPGHA